MSKDIVYDWMINQKGDLVNMSRNYTIEAHRLSEPDWILHLSEKSWVDMNTFIPAYLFALKNQNIFNVAINTSY